ncbi:MAG TPA: UPF0175 family protein [Planctomycetaceae bacterium]|nr:UPF0175 family protein [Planctomycetaceae bacterium]
MPLTITDELLTEAGITEQDARIEVACRLYDAGKLSLLQAMRWANLSRAELEVALIDRGLPVYKVTRKDFEEDMANLEKVLGKP